jgi:hypothetical protein
MGRVNRRRVPLLALVLVTVAVSAAAADTETHIARSKITGATKADPNVTRGTYSLSVRRGTLVAQWRGIVRHTTRLDFLIYAATKNGRLLPGFHGEPPQQSKHAIARRGTHRTVTVRFTRPRVLQGWPCAFGNVIDEPNGAPRVYPIGPMAFRLLCPHGGFGD